MDSLVCDDLYIEMPKGFIVFISGVPGVGKTTISYELLKMFDAFRIVEETDLIREVLRGYSDYIKDVFKDKAQFLFEEIDIAHSSKFLTYNDAKMQCEHMKKSLEKIIVRQKRKGISTIINGVHIVPDVLNGIFDNEGIIYFNLLVNNELALMDRWKNRDQSKYTTANLSTAFQTNIALYESMEKLSDKTTYLFNNIDVTDLNIEQTKIIVRRCIANRLQSFLA